MEPGYKGGSEASPKLRARSAALWRWQRTCLQRLEECMMRIAVIFAMACLFSGCMATVPGVPPAPPTAPPNYHCAYVGGGYFSCYPW